MLERTKVILRCDFHVLTQNFSISKAVCPVVNRHKRGGIVSGKGQPQSWPVILKGTTHQLNISGQQGARNRIPLKAVQPRAVEAKEDPSVPLNTPAKRC